MQILMTMEPTGLCNAEGKVCRRTDPRAPSRFANLLLPLLDQNLKRYYDKCPENYQKYRDNTSILWPFVGYGYVPKFLKRTFFLDFEKYEYTNTASTNKDE